MGEKSCDSDRNDQSLSIRVSPETRWNYPLKCSISSEMAGDPDFGALQLQRAECRIS
jgi:hypothetical protein